MRRILAYQGEVPYDYDILNTNRNVLIALGSLAQATLGSSTCVTGLPCTPAGGLTVQIGLGQIYSPGVVDATAYSDIGTDTTDTVMKQGILLAPVTLNCPAPLTSGQSIAYLIEAQYQDSDTAAEVLPYYNSANPASPLSGPGGLGTSQATQRDGIISLIAKAGTAATTGTQTPPSPDSGYTGLWVVTVAYGTATIVSGNIAQASGAPFLTFNALTALTQASADLRYMQIVQRTAAEVTAGVTPANLAYAPMCVDRYGVNSVPGTADMTTAFQAAVNVAKVAGGEVTYGGTSQYLLTGVIDCTQSTTANQPGICIRGLGVSSPDAGFGILAKHSGMSVFDCTGNDSITFENVSIKTDTTTFPQTGILTARNQYNGSLQIRLYNVRIAGHFGGACYYNYASEDDGLYSCYFANHNTAANTKAAVWTANNILGITSVVTGGIATGPHSCIDHTVVGCQFYNASGNAAVTNDCIYLEAVESFHLFGGWAYTGGPILCPTNSNPGTGGGVVQASATAGVMTVSLVSGAFTGALAVGQQINGPGIPLGTAITSFGTGSGGVGTYNIDVQPGQSNTFALTPITAAYAGRALIYVDMTNAPSNFCQIIGLTGEIGVPEQNYGVYFSNNVQTPENWLIDSCKLPNAGNAIFAGSNVTMSGLTVHNIGIQQGYGLWCVGIVQDSRIDLGYTVKIGTSVRNLITGDTSQFTVSTRTNDAWIETGATNRTFNPGVATTVNGWTATGAITQTGALDYIGNEARFTITLNGATNIAVAANGTITMPFTATQVSSASVCDSTGAALGFATLAAGSSSLKFPTAIATNTNTVIIQGAGFVS